MAKLPKRKVTVHKKPTSEIKTTKTIIITDERGIERNINIWEFPPYVRKRIIKRAKRGPDEVLEVKMSREEIRKLRDSFK